MPAGAGLWIDALGLATGRDKRDLGYPFLGLLLQVLIMARTGSGQKGTFSDLNLAVARRYVVPASRNRVVALGVVLGLVVVGLVLADFLQRDRSLVSNGPLSSHHANLEQDCAACHAEFSAVVDDKCSVCHEKYGDELGVYTYAAHYLYRSNDFQRLAAHEDEVACFACHPEHEGRDATITLVPDSLCLPCHAFGSFNEAHPPFAPTTLRSEDAPLKFPHVHHVREVLKSQELVDLEKACLYCHNPEEDGKGFQPLDFDRHCDACHLPATTRTPFLPLRGDDGTDGTDGDDGNGGVGVETLESIQERRPPGSLWAFYTNPAEFVRRGQRVRKGPVHHRDPWILENLRQLRSALYEEAPLADLLVASAQVPPQEIEVLYREALATLELQALELRSEPAVQRDLRRIDEALDQLRRRLQDPYTTLDETKFLLAFDTPRATLEPAEIEEITQVIDSLTEPCRTCHELRQATVARVRKSQRTLHRAQFDHRAHILQRRCLDCHYEIPMDLASGQEPVAAELDRAEIQNLPSVETCRECHNPTLASNRCVTCHFFHPNKSQRSQLLLYLD